jgi:DNA-binding HxlR family transcriptional regulator
MKSKRKVKKITPKMLKCLYCSFRTKNPGALGMHKKVHKSKKKRKVIVKKILTDRRLDNLILETLSKGRLRFPEISMSTKVGKRKLTDRLDKLIADGKILKVYQNGLVYYMLV